LGSAVVIGLRPCDFFDLSLDELDDIFEAYRKANSIEEVTNGSLSRDDVEDLQALIKRY